MQTKDEHNSYALRWYYDNKKKAAASQRKYRAAHKEKFQEFEHRRNQTPERKAQRKIRGWRERGIIITMDQYLETKKMQNDCCAICGTSSKTLKRSLDTDHNHRTGLFRGLLCTACNRGIGNLKDSPLILRKAAEYLERYKI